MVGSPSPAMPRQKARSARSAWRSCSRVPITTALHATHQRAGAEREAPERSRGGEGPVAHALMAREAHHGAHVLRWATPLGGVLSSLPTNFTSGTRRTGSRRPGSGRRAAAGGGLDGGGVDLRSSSSGNGMTNCG